MECSYLVRSKSELVIADKLHVGGIGYACEQSPGRLADPRSRPTPPRMVAGRRFEYFASESGGNARTGDRAVVSGSLGPLGSHQTWINDTPV